MLNKKSQITIFVIIALIIVVAIALIFSVFDNFLTGGGFAKNPQAGIQKCASDAIEEAIKEILPHGGYISPAEPTMLYDETKIAFLCYTSENEELCINKEPMLSARIKNEIKDYISGKVENCFDNLEYELKNYDYKAGPTSIEIDIKSGQILAKISKDISYTKNEQQTNIKNFNAVVESPMKDFIALSNAIINDELSCDCKSESCNADIVKLSLNNPKFEVNHFVAGNSEEIYSITSLESKEEFRFAIRNCVRQV